MMVDVEELRLMSEIHEVIDADPNMSEADKHWIKELQWANAEFGEIESQARYDHFVRVQDQIEIEAEEQGIPVKSMGNGDNETLKKVMEWTRTPAGTMWMAIGGARLGWEDRDPEDR